MINFCYDKLPIPNIGYPNLATWSAEPFTPEWRQFDAHWPRTVPLRLTMYLDAAHIPYSVSTVEAAPSGAWYPIAFSWFDFDCNYVGLLSDTVKQRINKKEIKLLFYYHEGDNPERIRSRLGKLCWENNLPVDCFVFVSANSAADTVDQCVYFQEHEAFFRHVNRKQRALDIRGPRESEFTALNRTHKWWRASVMSDLQHRKILDRSLWSYHTDCVLNDDPADNPIELDTEPGWRSRTELFVAGGPYRCDELNLQKQNDHHYVNTALYTDSYFQIVIETHFDADQSGGTFITEKTWKPIKFGQPFVVIGPTGTLDALRSSGYSVFDDVLDNTYDTVQDNTKRYFAVRNLIESMQQQGVSQLFKKCQEGITYNQLNFESRLRAPLNSLLEKLQCQI
jgi:hypothetical protein